MRPKPLPTTPEEPEDDFYDASKDETLAQDLDDAIRDEWPTMPVERRLEYMDRYPEMMARIGVSLDDPHLIKLPREEPPSPPARRSTPMSAEEFEASLVAGLQDSWPTMTLAIRRHYAGYRPERMARAGLSLDDPYKRPKRVD